MNDKSIKNSKNGKIISKSICNNQNDVEINVTYDAGMAYEYRRQLGGNRVWVNGSLVVFATENDMLDFANYFSVDGGLNKTRPATEKQIAYLVALGVALEDGMTVERASQLIDAAKKHIIGSVYGTYTDGSN